MAEEKVPQVEIFGIKLMSSVPNDIFVTEVIVITKGYREGDCQPHIHEMHSLGMSWLERCAIFDVQHDRALKMLKHQRDPE